MLTARCTGAIALTAFSEEWREEFCDNAGRQLTSYLRVELSREPETLQ
jgi:hypothetical protein